MMSAATSDKIKEKRERILQAAKGSGGEPTVSEENYKIDMCKALSYYNAFYDLKTRRSWAVKYFKKHSMQEELKITEGNAADYHFLQIGSICRLLDRGQYVSPEHQKQIFSKIFDIKSEVKEENKKVQRAEQSAEKNEAMTDKVMEDINSEIDQFILTKSTKFDPAV